MNKLLTSSHRESILSVITPTKEEVTRQHETIEEFRDKIANYANLKDIRYSFIEAQGSTGKKQTQLRGASDIDLFIALDPSDYDLILSQNSKHRNTRLDKIFETYVDDWLIPAIKKTEASSFEKAYSQHPYLSVTHLENDVDILLCFDLSAERIAREGPITAVDRTIHHSEYISRRLNERLREDVRILKSFVRANHAYGDRCAVGQMGFTGVSLEILVIEHGSLEGAMLCIPKLQEHPIDPCGRNLDVLKDIPAFRDNHIFIIDPTDTNRNIASSFSTRSYKWIKRNIESLMMNQADVPSVFLEKPIPVRDIPSAIKPHIVVFEFEVLDSVHYTIVRDKLYSFARKLSNSLETENTGETRFGRTLFEIYFEGSRFALGYLIQNPIISNYYAREGPPITIPAAAEFKKVHKDTYEKSGHLWIDVERKWINAARMLEYLISSNPPEHLERTSEKTEVSLKMANILHSMVIPVEGFVIR